MDEYYTFSMHRARQRPGGGVGPLTSAAITQDLVVEIETALAQESHTARGYNFAVPDPKQAVLAGEDLQKSRGALNLMQSTMADAAWGMGPESRQSDDWVSRRFGFMPPLPMVELRSRTELSILAAAGVPVTIMSQSDGTAKAKDFARFLTLTMVPLGKIIAQQIGDALGVSDLSFHVPRSGGSRSSGEGTCFRTTHQQRRLDRDAAEVAGLPISDTTPAPMPRPTNDA